MSNLGFLENKLGSLHNWPQDILQYLFLFDRLSTYTTLELAAFFYGNKIPLNTALDLFRECCETTSENIEFFCEKYATWERRKDREHIYEYYDMSKVK
jgi:hypothetical protein